MPIAVAQASAKYGHTFAPEEVWVIGDTPQDLASARAAGARCLLVGTGRPAFHELRRLDADAVLPDLADVAAVCELLLSDQEGSVMRS